MKTYIITMASGAKHEVTLLNNGLKSLNDALLNMNLFEYDNIILNGALIESVEEILKENKNEK